MAVKQRLAWPASSGDSAKYGPIAHLDGRTSYVVYNKIATGSSRSGFTINEPVLVQ